MPLITRQSARRYRMRCAAAALCATIALSGCSSESFLGRQFDDFTAHYNKFYNANRTFREQERKLEEGEVKIDADRYLAIFEVPKQRGRSAELEKVITKCADLLRNHPRSKWVDDALMLIGKSYFHQSNFVGAEQKFNEIINLDGKLREEAEFWLARTLVAGQSTAAAEDIIGSSLAREDLDREWRSLFLLLRGDLRTREGAWQTAIEDIRKGLEHVKDGDIAARAYYLLGQLLETEGQYEQSAAAFRRVQSKKPLYELSYAAHYAEIRVLGRHVDPELSLKKLDGMLRDNKHFQNRHDLVYLQARILAETGDPELAESSFHDQLYPSDPTRKTSLRGEVHYRLGELYRDFLGDFYRAGVHFDTASTALRTISGQNERLTPDAIVDARATAATFRSYRETLDEVSRMDSLLHLGSLDAAAFDSAVAVVREKLAEEAARIQAELERRQTATRFRQAATDLDNPSSSTNVRAREVEARGSFGFLNHRNLQRVQEAFANFKQVWGDRPLVPGWRREEAVAVAERRAQDSRGVDGDVEGAVASQGQVRFLPPVDVSEVPRDPESQAKMRAERAEARYRLANVLFLSIGLPDSAARWYRLVFDEDRGEPVATRALYAMAEVHDALGDTEASERTFERVIEAYPESEFAVRARVRLGLQAETTASAPDSLEIATSQYESAYGLWRAGQVDAATRSMLRVAADHSRSPVAAKALLAVGAIFLEQAHRDSADLYGVIELPDSVFTEAEIAEAMAELETADPPATADDTTTGGETGVVIEDSTQTETEVEVEEIADRSETSVDTLASVDSSPSDSLNLAELVVDTLAFAEPAPRDSVTLTRRTDDALMEKLEEGVVGPAARLDEDRLTVRRRRDALPVDDAPAMKPSVTEDTKTTDLSVVDDATAEPGAVPSVDTTSSRKEVAARRTMPDSSRIVGAGSAPADTSATAKAKPAPKIEWTEPDYHIKDLIPVPMTLHSLYEAVAKQYADSPYGQRANALLRGIEAARLELAVAETRAEAPPATEDPAPGDAGLPVEGLPTDTAAVDPVPMERQVLAPPDSLTVTRPAAPDSASTTDTAPARRRPLPGDP